MNRGFIYKILKLKKQLANRQSGFSLVDVLLVVAILTIILASAVSIVPDRVSKEDLGTKSKQIIEFVAQARNYSMSGYFGDVWGIKVLDGDSTCQESGDCLVMFKGKAYSYRDSSYDRILELDTGVYIDADQMNEFYFSYKAGWLSTTTASSLGEQSIVLNSNIGQSNTIRIAPTGMAYLFTCGENFVYDIEGQEYHTTQIADQCWMSQNLNTGTMLASAATDPTDNSQIEKWCYNDSASNCAIMGGLYSWQEAMGWVTTESAQGICPNDWHLPSDAEFDTLVANYPSASAGTELKTNGVSGFQMIMAGEMDTDTNTYDSGGTLIVFWTSTDDVASTAKIHYNGYADANMSQTENPYGWGFSVRCIKD